LIAVSTLLTANDSSAQGSASLHGWNVVLITLDATNAARIGVYGGSPATMPFFDSLAQHGLLVMHAYTITGSTSPAHATLLSGVLPETHKVFYNGVPLAPRVFWLPEELQKEGYVTVGSTVAFFLHDLNKMDRGFDHFEYPKERDSATRPWTSNRVAYQSFREHCLPLLSSGRPFFAMIHLKGGHAPLAPVAEEFLRRYSKTLPPDKAPRIATAEELAVGAVDAVALQRDQLAYYDANLSEADDTLKEIFADFKARGLTAKTLFVITADHGESYDHGFSGDHWPSPYESTLHVPLLFYTESGAIPAGRLDDRLVSHADLVATLAYLLGGRLDMHRRASSMNMFARTRRTAVQVSSVSALSYEEDLRWLIARRKPNLMYPIKGMLQRHSALVIALGCGALALAIWAIATGLSLRRLRFVSVAVLLLLISGVSIALIATTGTKKDTEDLERLGVFYWARIEMMPDGIYKLLHLGRRPGLLLTRRPVRLFNVTADPGELTELLQTESGKRPIAAQMLDRSRDADPFFGLFLSNLKGSEPEVRESVKRRLDSEAIEKLKSLGYLQ
jgi:hypothetical protein